MKPKIFTFVILLAAAYTNYAQPVIVDQKTIGGNIYDYFKDLYLTKDGGLIIGGYSGSGISGDKTQKSRGFEDYWIVKLNRHHTIQWDKTIGGHGEDMLSALQQTSDDGYILAGNSDSRVSGEKTENTRGLDDYWIVKLDSAGHISWDKTVGGSYFDELTDLQQTKAGRYILGGFSNSKKSGEKTQKGRGSDDYWVVKLDSAGNVNWDKTIGGSYPDDLFALQQTYDGGYILAGYSSSGISGEKTDSCRGGYDYWIVKTDGLGKVQWDKTIGGSGYDYLESVQQTSDGYILGGYSNSNQSGEKTQKTRGGYDYWVIKLDSLGNIQWDKTIGGTGQDRLSTVVQTVDGGYILGGTSNSNISGEKTENSKGYTDYWIVKLNRDGKIQWDKTIGGKGSDELLRIKEISKNNYVLGGHSSSGISGDKTDTCRGAFDYWIVYLNYIQPSSQVENKSSATIEKINEEFIVYPIPAKEIVHIQANAKTLVTLTDAAGKILLTKTIDGSGEIDVSKFSAGVYFLKDHTTGNIQKLVVVK